MKARFLGRFPMPASLDGIHLFSSFFPFLVFFTQLSEVGYLSCGQIAQIIGSLARTFRKGSWGTLLV